MTNGTLKLEIRRSIAVLSKKICGNIESTDALKYTQAALNLANVLSILGVEEREK